MNRNWTQILVAAALGILAGCGSSSADSTAQSSPDPSPTPIVPYHASSSQLQKMREDWNNAVTLVLPSGDSVHGQIGDLLDNPEESRDYPILTNPPDVDEAVAALPKHWDTVHGFLRTVADDIETARTDFTKWKDGADVDDDLKAALTADRNAIPSAMCDALQEARTYYRAAGGYPNDLSFVLISDKADQPCQNVPMTHPYETTMRHAGIVTIDESSNENPEVNNPQAFLDDHTGFMITTGTVVRVIGHRYVDSIESQMCQIHGGGASGWVPCGWIHRQPAAIDG